MTQIIRLSSILQALENSFIITNQLKSVNKFLINKELETELDHLVKNSVLQVTISLSCFENAKRLISYYNLHKLTMAGYEYKNENFDTNELKVNSIIDKISTKANNNIEPNIARTCKKILYSNGPIVNSTSFAQLTRSNIKLVQDSFKVLTDIKLGSIQILNKGKQAKGPKSSLNFIKISILEISKNLSVITTMEQLQINLNTYKENYEKPMLSQSKLKSIFYNHIYFIIYIQKLIQTWKPIQKMRKMKRT